MTRILGRDKSNKNYVEVLRRVTDLTLIPLRSVHNMKPYFTVVRFEHSHQTCTK